MLEAVNDFILEYTDIEQDKLFRGWQNRMALPSDQEYCLYYLSSTKRIGTNTKNWSDFVADVNTLREYVVTIDINDIDSERAMNRAATLETIARSYLGTTFFKKRNCGLLYADDIRYMPFTDENHQYIYRYLVDLHLTAWNKAQVPQDSAIEVKIDKFINVDQYIWREKQKGNKT